MICPRCGKENNNGAKFCGGCGFPLAAAGHNQRPSQEPLQYGSGHGPSQGPSGPGNGQGFSGASSYRGDSSYPPPGPDSPYSGRGYGGGGYGAYPPDPDGGRDEGGKTQKFLFLFAGLIAVAIIGLSAFLILSSSHKDNKADSETRTEQKKDDVAEASTEQEAGSTEADTIAPVSSEEEPVTTEAEEMENNLPYCDNGGIDLIAHQKVSDFQVMTSQDGSFTFSYPKYVFNHSEVNDDGSLYYFSYVNDEGEEEISLKYTRTYDPGDSKKIVMAAQKKYLNRYVNADYQHDYKGNKPEGPQYVAIATGTLNQDGSLGEYAMVENDGEYTCRMELFYPRYSGDEYDHLQYIINMVYRQCSFSYTKKIPVSYKEMVKENIFD